MRARFRPTDRIEFDLEAQTPKDMFTILAQTEEVFGEAGCGRCGESDLYYKVRQSKAKKGNNAGKTFTYFEVVCRGCGCFLAIGQHNNDKGTLFPDRKLVDDKGNYVIKDGQKVFDKEFKGWRKPGNRTEDGDE